MLPPLAELPIQVSIRGREHPAVAGRNNFPRMKRKACDIAVRLPNRLPLSIPKDLAANRAGCILNDWHPEAAAYLNDATDIARHPQLMYAQNGLRTLRRCRFDQRRIHVVGTRLDVAEYRSCTAVPDSVRRRDERMADRDDFITGSDADSQQREMQRGRAAG